MTKWETTIELSNVQDESITDKLLEYILSNYDLNNPPSDSDNNDLFVDNNVYIQKFKNEIVVPKFNNYILKNYGVDVSKTYNKFKSWITGSKEGYYMSSHNHSGSQFTGVFYIFVKNPELSGPIILTDPRYNANRGYDSRFQHSFSPFMHHPKSGDFIIFPSYLYHQVGVSQSNMRIAIPIDMFIFTEKQKPVLD